MNVMWKLTIEDDEGSQTSLQLASAEYHIGRDEGNNVRLTDRNVSRRHATLKRNGDETWHLVDHESYNGSFVNGQRVAGSASLGHADLIQLGDYRIFLTNEERALAPPSASGRPAASMPPTPEYPDRLVVLAGPEPGFECRLDRGVVTIGRSEECTFAINHPSVSRVHAVVHPVAPGRFEILDKDSANGLRINGVDMRRKILEGGDIIEFGDVQMRYFEQGQAPPITSDISQRVRSIPAPSSPSSVHPGARTEAIPRGRAGRWGAIALAVLAVGVGVAALQSRPRTPPGPAAPIASAPIVAADDASNAQLERARGLVHTDPADALRIISAMPDGPRRRAADVSDLASQAAEAVLRGASNEADPERRRPMLAPLLNNPLVSRAQRDQANDLLKPIPAVVLPPPASPTTSAIDPTAPRSSGGRERPGPGGTRTAPDEGGDAVDPSRPATARAGGRERAETRDREGAAVRPAARPREGREDTVDTSQAIQDESTTRRSLESRLANGKATAEELRMLQAICKHQGDTACKERAQEAIRKLSE